MLKFKTAREYFLAAAYALLLGVTFLFLFINLDGRLLWGDEAETAVLARQVLRYGVPKTLDGVNHISLHGPMDENADHVWTWSPWLQEYVVASAFYFLGPTTWAARAPFALVAWLSVVLFGVVSYRIYRDHRISLTCILLLGGSEVFLLHARQCRYYSLSLAAQIVLIYGVDLMLAKKRTGIALVALAFVVHFYTNYIMVFANSPVLAFLAVSLYRRERRRVLDVAVAAAVALAAMLPWILYAEPWRQFAGSGKEEFLPKAWIYIREFHFHFLPLCFLLLPVLGWRPGLKKGTVPFLGQFFGRLSGRDYSKRVNQEPNPKLKRDRKRSAGRSEAELLVASDEGFALLEWHLVGLFVLYLALINVPPGPHARYLLPLLPVACLLGAAWTWRYVRWTSLAVALILVQAGTNLWSLATAYPIRGSHQLRSGLFEFVGGLRENYRDRCSDVLTYLQKEAKSGETILTPDPEFFLIFYSKLQVLDVRIAGPPTSRAPDWMFAESPSWIVPTHPLVPTSVIKPLYDTINLEVHDSERGASVPDPDYYRYHTTERRAPFLIYKLKKQPHSLAAAFSDSP
jgi:hypothetical protein